jgi:Acetyltransferase (GNAT) domain
MNAVGMAEFLERLGHRVIATPSAWWYDVRSRFYLSAPHHRLIDPGPDELSVLFRRLPLGVRYFAKAEGQGPSSYALTCATSDYDLSALSANTRSKTRRGLARCAIERLSPSWVAAHGREVNEDTLRRIRLRDPYPWDVYWRAAAQSECVEVWGALVDGRLAAYLVGVLADRCCELLVARSSSDMLKFYPNNALLYTVVRDMLGRPDVDQIFFGVESLEDYEGIDAFKLSMGFAKSPLRQRVVLHPLLRPVLQSALARRVLAGLAERRPHDERWRKLRGIVALASPATEAP